MNKLFKLLTFVALSAMCGCTDDDIASKLYFVGDSLIANWDLQESFPSQITVNKGVCGNGVEYLESFLGEFGDGSVVILSGTNDCMWLAIEDVDEYADRYVAALMSMRARKYYVYSILPRDYDKFGDNIRDVIVAVNKAIKERLQSNTKVVYMDVYDSFLYKDSLNPNLALDGVHLNAYGYEILAAELVHKF